MNSTLASLRGAVPSSLQPLDPPHKMAKHKDTDCPFSYLEALVRVESKIMETTLRKRRDKVTIPVECVMLGELVEEGGGVGREGGRK